MRLIARAWRPRDVSGPAECVGLGFHALDRAGVVATEVVQVLENRRGHVDLITDLVNQEIRAQPPSDAVVFLGPLARYGDKVPRQSLEKNAGLVPRFFYFQVMPFFRAGRGGLAAPALPDSIHSAISRLNGKVLVIHTPGELAKAITRLEQLAGN